MRRPRSPPPRRRRRVLDPQRQARLVARPVAHGSRAHVGTVDADRSGPRTIAVMSTVNGICHHDCPDSCGWTLTVEDGVATKLRGNPNHPYSYGELCPKV